MINAFGRIDQMETLRGSVIAHDREGSGRIVETGSVFRTEPCWARRCKPIYVYVRLDAHVSPVRPGIFKHSWNEI